MEGKDSSGDGVVGDEAEAVSKALRERLEEHNENRILTQTQLSSKCNEFKKEVDEAEGRLFVSFGKRVYTGNKPSATSA